MAPSALAHGSSLPAIIVRRCPVGFVFTFGTLVEADKLRQVLGEPFGLYQLAARDLKLDIVIVVSLGRGCFAMHSNCCICSENTDDGPQAPQASF